MKRLTTLILLFCSLAVFGQLRNPLAYYKFNGNYDDSSGNGYNATAYGDAGHDPLIGYTGGYSIGFDGVNDRVSLPVMDLGTNFAFSFWARTVADVDATAQNLIYIGGATNYFRVYVYMNQIRVGTTGSNNAYYAEFTSATWHHVLIDINKTTSRARIYVDGIRPTTQTDSTISTSFTSNDSIWLGLAYSSVNDFYGNIDEFMVLKDIVIDQAKVDSCFNLDYLDPPSGTPYSPVQFSPSYALKGRLRPSYGGITMNMRYGVTPESLTDPIIYFADNFETWPLMSEIPYDTVMYRWQAIMPNYYPSNQSIISVSGYGNVWRSQYLDQQGGPGYGFEISPMLDSSVTEIYVDVDCYWSPTWYDPPTYGYSGKAPWGGAFGGDFWLGDNYAYVDTVGDYNSTRGWGAHNGWGSGDPNHVRAYLYDQLRTTSSGGYVYVYSVDPFVYTLTTVTRGEWHKYTTRIKLNTPGKQDGILAQYKDGVMFMQDTTVMFRSLDQANHLLNKIDGLIIKYAFGGGPSYISEQTNVIYMDNIVAYYYPTSSPYYLAGPDDVNGETHPIGGIIDETIYPDQILFNETFTASTDTIKSHYSGASYVPSSQNIITKTINGHTNPIRLVFLRWDDGLNGVEGITSGATKSDSWVKIFTGTDTGGTPTYWYQEPGEHNGIPTIGNTLTINSTSCTIQYFPGKDWNKGWTIRYY